MTGGAARPAVSHRRIAAYDIYAKDDGRDYWSLAHAYLQAGVRQGELAKSLPDKPEFTLGAGENAMLFSTLSCSNPKRLVFRVDTRYGRYLLKWMRRGSIGLKRLFPNSAGLTYYTRLFQKVRRAVDGGCEATQDYYLVAERWIGAFRMEVVTVLEYIEGEPMGWRDDYSPFADQLARMAESLFRHGLTLDDMSPDNFLVTSNGIRAIDLSCRPPTRLNTVKMAMKMNARFGLDIPVRGAIDRTLRALLSMRYAARKWVGKRDM